MTLKLSDKAIRRIAQVSEREYRTLPIGSWPATGEEVYIRMPMRESTSDYSFTDQLWLGSNHMEIDNLPWKLEKLLPPAYLNADTIEEWEPFITMAIMMGYL